MCTIFYVVQLQTDNFFVKETFDLICQ